MKSHQYPYRSLVAPWITLTIVAIANTRQCVAEVMPPPPEVTVEEVVASARATILPPFNDVTHRLEVQNMRLVKQLLQILKDSSSPEISRCFAAYYLGEIRTPDAVDALAGGITLTVDLSRVQIDMLPRITEHPAMDALVKIGCPSIPAVIRNLGDSDDALVRELSLKVLYRVEGDKEIAKIRLQRALDVQKDPQKQARLQSALKSLSEMQLGN